MCVSACQLGTIPSCVYHICGTATTMHLTQQHLASAEICQVSFKSALRRLEMYCSPVVTGPGTQMQLGLRFP